MLKLFLFIFFDNNLFRTEEGVVRNPYKWISKKEEQEKKNKKKAGEKPTDTSQVLADVSIFSKME